MVRQSSEEKKIDVTQNEGISYEDAGVSIKAADAVKARMGGLLATEDPDVLNGVGPFASLYRLPLEQYQRPILVFKTDEPGSKQKLAVEHGYLPSLCEDLIHHLLNDVLAMGARPLIVQDAIICGELDPDTVELIVNSLADACKAQDCALVGGETSEQPGILGAGTYVLTASCIGLVEESRIVDGRAIKEGDTLLAFASNGLHTNGYSLVRALIAREADLLRESLKGESFLDVIMRPHRCYGEALKLPLEKGTITGLAHITGGGLQGNVRRIMPHGLCAEIDLSAVRVLPIFQAIRDRARASDEEMLKTFNLGVGMVASVRPDNAEEVRRSVVASGVDCYDLGRVVAGDGPVAFARSLDWTLRRKVEPPPQDEWP